MSEKLQKVLARIGLGSRRYMEEVIAAGRVSVNGQIAQVGERIEPGDELRIDGRKVQFQVEDEIRRRVLIYYKPEGEICSPTTLNSVQLCLSISLKLLMIVGLW